MNLIDKYLPEGKKKKISIDIDRGEMDKKKALRIPTPPKGGTLFDKPKYNRKKKHQNKY